jgi:hypothetical protein
MPLKVISAENEISANTVLKKVVDTLTDEAPSHHQKVRRDNAHM